MLEPEEKDPHKTSLVESLLLRAERVDLLRFNLWMLFGIVVLSALLSLVLWLAAVSSLGWIMPEGAGLLIFLIAATVSFAVGAPSVLLGYLLIARINTIGSNLRSALAAADLANRSKTEFLANMSHEVRTPLNGLLGMASVLESSPLDNRQREALRVIQDSGEVLMALITEVLDLSKIDVGQVTLEYASQPLGPVLSSCVDLFRPKAAERGNRISMFIEQGVPELAHYDSVRARQCLGNLVSNAVKFTRNGEIKVTLSTRPVQDGWMVDLSVKDTGIGIADEDIKRLFKPFQQVGTRSAHAQGGTGLGLAISHRLAELMGGELTVSSVPGKGSDFRLSFWAGSEVDLGRPASSLALESGAIDLSGVRAMVVDDTHTNRIVVRSMLQARGAKCLEAEDGAAALRLVQQEEIDVILMDIRMPDKDGFDVLKDIRALGGVLSDIPIVALTADVMSATREQYLAWGFADYISKPIDIDNLACVVRMVVPTKADASGRAQA